MASITMDLKDFNSLMALGTSSRGRLFLDLYNTGRTKAGESTSTGADSVVVAPSNPNIAVDPKNTVVTRVKAAIAAAA
ncbi:hypothetical protein NC315_13545 [Streptomyces sp. G2]|uniref:hypothetical protein n=1 Tax=Streptomyces sp. G2 TaxID=1684471 RepID=UPI00202E831D|nr:hypothetical protein [Streptomyces sp. G2]MCM1946394.1 hypothetical protein [Streptomyces sp. G2]